MPFTAAPRFDTMPRPAGAEGSVEMPLPSFRSPASGICWGAVLAGAAGAAALSLILLILGTGLGLSAISPWAQDGIGAQELGTSTIAWLAVTQILAATLGGYLAGRLRGQWADVQTDEVYFRDTAHGFLSWAVASLASAAMLSAAIGAIVGGVAQAGAGVAKAAADLAPVHYVTESLFRQPAVVSATAGAPTTPSAAPLANPADRSAVNAEVNGIFMNTLRSGELQAEDLRYVGQLVASRTGLSEADATQRVRDGYARAQAALRDAEAAAKEQADRARKAAAHAALWMFIALLAGAFMASLAATFGGRQRDL